MMKPNLFVFITTFLLLGCTKESDSPRPVDKPENWYDVSSVDGQTWIIQEPRSSQANVSYLISGTDRAIMFDAGTGENKGQDGTKMLYQVQEITNLPVTLLLSHFHFDHNQNVEEFEKVAFPDLSYLREAVDEEDVYSISKSELFVGGIPSSIKVSEWLPIGANIDLGNRNIQLISLPGHARESVVVLDHDKKQAFMGDFLYSGALFAFDATQLRTYLNSMDKFIEIVGEDYTLYGAHGIPKVSYQHLLDSRELLHCIVNGNCYSESLTTVFGKNATIYSSLDGRANLFLVHAK